MMNKIFNDSITSRYKTVEKNIKSISNSFYDSYLDMLEETIKYFLIQENIGFDDSRTCGYLVKDDIVKDFLLNTLKLDNFTYNKLPDYIKKCNDHKHKKEKRVQIEGIINFLKIYFDFINYYATYKNMEQFVYDSNYYISIYGETERLNKKYKLELGTLKEELDELYVTQSMTKTDLEDYKSLLSLKEVEILSLDEQNQILQIQLNILKDIKLHTLEGKLDEALDLLINLKAEAIENRIANDAVYRVITGKPIKDAIKQLKEKKDD